jgi:hypothetical protein
VRILAVVATAVLVSGGAASAHDVPDEVIVQAFLRPAGDRLSLLVRVPLTAMRDVDVPTVDRYVDLGRVDAALRHAATIWLVQGIELFEDGQPIGDPTLTGVRLSLPSDRAFETAASAAAHIVGPPLDPATRIAWEQGALDARIDYPIRHESGRFAVRTDFRRLGQRVTVVLRLLTPEGSVRAFEWQGDPGLVQVDPRWYQAALSFLRSGIGHVFSGPDHLLFLLCIAIPLRRVRTLALVVTSFTIAHATTLIASVYGLAPGALWFPPLVETLIAVSIVWMAIENIVQIASADAAAGLGSGLGRRWAITTLFGLVHGFGFSFALRERLQFAGSHLLTSLLAFNIGVEIAQLVVIVAAATAVTLLLRRMAAPRVGAILLSALAAHTGWHWMIERAQVLQQFPWPEVPAGMLIPAAVWTAIAALAAATAWAVRILVDRRGRRTAAESPASYPREATESVR